MMRVIWKGEDDGHPFRGNQYTNVGGRLVATHRKVGKPVMGRYDSDVNTYGTDKLIEETRPLVDDLKEGGYYLNYGNSPDNPNYVSANVSDHEVRSQMKANICRELAKRTGYKEDEISDILHDWASDSNGYGSLRFQQAVADEFGLPLSSYQKRRIKTEGAEVFRGYYNYNRDRKVARAMYEYTQEKLAAGPKYITLYRGITSNTHNSKWFMETKWALNSNRNVASQYRGNAIESWSSRKETASYFGSTVLAMHVPREAIFTTAFSGLGCLNEYEFVIFGNPSGRPHTVGVNDEDFSY